MKRNFGFYLSYVLLLAMFIFAGLVPYAGTTHVVTMAAEAPGLEQSAEEGQEEEGSPLVFDDEFLKYVSISQDGYSFTAADFSEQTFDDEKVGFTIFTNKTISISSKYRPTPEDEEEDEDAEPNEPYYLSLSIDSVLIEDGNPSKKTINGIDYYVIDIASAEGDTRHEVRLSISGSVQLDPISFYVVQTPKKFSDGGITWGYGSGSVLTSLREGNTYSPLTVNIPDGSRLNPIFIKFLYGGETFEVYNIDGKLYNKYDDEQPLDFPENKLTLDVSGEYNVEIYDNTSLSGYSDNNVIRANFKILNTSYYLSQFYFDARQEDGSEIMSGQIVNSFVTLKFMNLTSSIRADNLSVEVIRSYGTDSEHNVPERNTYTGSEMQRLNDTLVLSEDGNYRITMTVTPRGGQRQTRQFNFNIVTTIRTYFETEEGRIEMEQDTPNTIFPETRTLYIETTYPGAQGAHSITSTSSYTFSVRLARSDPSLTGFSRSGSGSDPVNLTVHGVGDINVTITKDGRTTHRVMQNNEYYTLSTPGKYHVVMTDEMGYSAQATFTITIKINTAAIILIVIAGVGLLLSIVLIIISRMRVKVR